MFFDEKQYFFYGLSCGTIEICWFLHAVHAYVSSRPRGFHLISFQKEQNETKKINK